MPSDYSAARVRANPCPHCHVGERERCRALSGAYAGEEHTRRKGIVYPRYLRSGTEKKRGIPPAHPLPHERNTMTKTKLPNKMTAAQKRKAFREFTPGALVDITFAPIDTFDIDYDGDINMSKSGAQIPREWLNTIVGRSSERFEVDDDWNPEDEEQYGGPTLYHSSDDYTFDPADPCIHSVKVAKHGKKIRRVYLGSIDQTMVITEGEKHIAIGCSSLSSEDAEKAATAIFTWLGYEVG